MRIEDPKLWIGVGSMGLGAGRLKKELFVLTLFPFP